MPQRAPEMDRRAFLKVLDSYEPFKNMITERHADCLRIIETFRTRVGDNCSYVTAGLKKIWHDEWERDFNGFKQHLRTAGYPV